jgi:membrane protein required for beta-lactamase induction
MKLIVILLCLWLDHYMHVGARGRQQYFFNLYEDFLKKAFEKMAWWQGPASLVMIAAPIVLLVGGLQLFGFLHANLVTLFLGVAVLLFCLGTSPLQAKLDDYLTADEAKAAEAEQSLRTFMQDAGVKTEGSFFRAVTELEFWQCHERFFAIVFWFLILGPIGAIVYRMISWFHDNAIHGESMYANQAEQMTWLHGWAAWLPSRLVSLTYTLVGNFMASFDTWYKNAFKLGFVHDILVDCGMASLGIENTPPLQADKLENLAAQALIHRGLLMWVLLIAVATMAQLFL